jgi:hypothetical protein
MAYTATIKPVHGRGVPPTDFLDQLVAWGKNAPEEIFIPGHGFDIYSSVSAELGPWEGPGHRRAAMLEVMRVLAGFESSWKWNCGKDTSKIKAATAANSEAGAWQVSADSIGKGADLKSLVIRMAGSVDPSAFQRTMKQNHPFAMEYIARLLRHTVNHNGPVKRREIHSSLRKDAVREFLDLMYTASPSLHPGIIDDMLPKYARPR